MPPARYPPTTARPHAAAKTPNKRRASAAPSEPLADPVPIEDFPPPAWRTVLNSRADLGYPDFYPSRPGFGQPEDELPEPFVKGGFQLKPAVNMTAESFSMHGPVYQQLQTGGLEKLMELGREIIEKRNATMPTFQERAFRIPVRVTYNDTKRHQFFADLANPDIPLTRLMKNPVPHGFKGVDLLETMFSPPQPTVRAAPSASSEPRQQPSPIPVDRALWFIRVLGANEISAHRGRAQPITVQAPSPAGATPSSTATSAPNLIPMNSNDWYTTEFTNSFTAWLRMQLVQLVLPTKVKPGAPVPKAPTGVLGDEKSRARWLAKWQYSDALLQQLYRKRLISPRQLASWLADFLGTANFAQLGYVTQLLHENLADVAEYPSIARHCVRSACIKIEEIRSSPAKDLMAKTQLQLGAVVKCLYESDPEVLLSPTTWARYSTLLGSLVGSATPTFEELGRRNAALLFRPTTVDSGASPRRQQMAEISMLDSICAETDMSGLCKAFFSGACAPSSPKIDLAKLEDKVFILVNWAMGLQQLGAHRPYAVYTILKKWQQWHEDVRPNEHFDFFPILYKWLDSSAAAQRPENNQAIGISFGELTRQGLFSYGRYLNTLIARGHSARFTGGKGPPSHHLQLLNAMPIFVEAHDLREQRRLVLSGDGEARQKDQADEDQSMDAIRQEWKEYTPEVFGLRRHGRSALFRESIDHQLACAPDITRFEFVELRFAYFAAAVNHFKRNGSQPAMNASTYARVMNVFMQCLGYSTLADFIVKGITGTEDEEVLLVILDSIRRDADAWTSIDRWNQIATALVARFRKMQRKNRFFRPLATTIIFLHEQGRITDTKAVAEVKAAAEANKPKSPPTPSFSVDMDESMRGMRQVITSGDTERAVALAPKLFSRHGKFELWAATWWASIIQAVQSADASKQSAVNAAAAHVGEVINQTEGDQLRPVVAAWIQTLTPAARVDIFGRRNVPPVIRLLLLLVIDRRLGSKVLLEQLIFPELKHAATLCSAAYPRLSSKRIAAIEWAVTAMQQLLLNTPHKSLPPANLREAYIVQTARASVFHASNVHNLINQLPVLVVLERSKVVPEKTRSQIGDIFRGLASIPRFKTAAFRNLDVLKDAFLSNDWIKRSNDSSLETGMVEGLKLMMSDNAKVKGSVAVPNLEGGARYSAWRWTRIVLEMRVEFKRLTMRIANNDDPQDARQVLSRLVRSSLDREATTDDMDLLVEAFRGADSVVAQEILSVGLDRIAVLLSQLLSAETQHEVEESARAVDMVLRVISSAGRQERLDPATAAARDRLFNLLSVAFQSIERQMTPDEDEQILLGTKPIQPGDMLQVVLQLLRFTLSIPSTEVLIPASPKPDYSQLAVAFLHLAVAMSARGQVQTHLDMMRDVLIYLVDMVPASSQASVYIALSYEASTPVVQDFLSRCPSFATALPRPTPVYRAMALSHSHGDDDQGLALDDRPWEMIEQMFTQPRQKHADLFLSSRPMKDTSSIPIALFKPQLSRDEVPDAAREHPQPWHEASAERNLGNGYAGEPIAARQSATILFARDDGHDMDDEAPMALPPAPQRAKRLSTRLTAPVELKGAGTTHDPIAIDSASDSDSDIEVVRPAAKRPRTGSKTTTARHVTGGKAPRKASSSASTVAANSTARKATGGKGVRSVSGKDVKGRRRSGQE